jgi:hypothetical protein
VTASRCLGGPLEGATGRSAILPIVTRDLGDPSWLDGAVRLSTLAVDGSMAIAPDFYFGPQNGFTQTQWQALRDPIGVPLPSRDGWLPVELGLTHLDALIEHHRRLFEIARRHGKPIRPGSPEVWMRPRILGDGTIALTFPWTDTYASTDSILSALCAEGEGELLWDLDQGWEFAAQRMGDDLIIGERDWERDDDPGRVLVVERTRFVAAADAARARIDHLLTQLTEALDEDPWAFRSRRPRGEAR